MGDSTKIEWCDHTFNPWIGCTKVSDGKRPSACDFCYAETLARRYGWATWGPGEARRLTSEANWREPKKWDRAAAKAGTRRRVFCASLADVFDAEVDGGWRNMLFMLINTTPNLDWLLLTKRPQVAAKYFAEGVPDNVWLGTTVETQAMADLRIPILLSIPAKVRFLSCEPLLGPIDLRQWLHDYGCGCGWGGQPLDYCNNCGWRGHAPGEYAAAGVECPGGCGERLADYNACPECQGHDGDGMSFGPNSSFLHWVITGGESGPKARPSHPDWFRSLRDQCAAAAVPFFFKQWGEWGPDDGPPSAGPDRIMEGRARCAVRTGDAWTFHANGYEPAPDADNGQWVFRLGKKAAGALLDGREWHEFPS